MVKDKRKLLTIRKRQLKFIGHVVRDQGIENLVIEGKIEGKRARQRQRTAYMVGIIKALGNITVSKLLHSARDRRTKAP